MTHWRLDAGVGDAAQTIALTTSGGIPAVIWWGAALPHDEDLSQLAAATRSDLTGGMLDALPALSLTPEAGRAFVSIKDMDKTAAFAAATPSTLEMPLSTVISNCGSRCRATATISGVSP